MANQYVNKFVKDGVTKFDLTSDTVTAATLKSGYTAHNSAGQRIVGTATIKPLELGLRADFANNTFTRLGDAVGLSGGSDFDNFPMYKRRRCNLANDGTVNAYLGDANYAVDGSNGQVMVEQPKFYYKVNPIVFGDTSTVTNLQIVEYWISDEPLDGYKLHPAFKNTALQEIDNFYESAYYAKISNGEIKSVSGVYPSYESRTNFRSLAESRGAGWYQETIWSLSADQLLMIIEYGQFNMQNAIGKGSNSGKTGSLNQYGNGTYGNKTDFSEKVQWRGKEGVWGLETWTDGVGIHSGRFYIADSYTFDNLYSASNDTSMAPESWRNYNNYISAFGYYNSGRAIWKYDWLFAPRCLGTNSSLPVGDKCTFINDGNRFGYVSSGEASTYSDAGAFYVAEDNPEYYHYGRLLYVG